MIIIKTEQGVYDARRLMRFRFRGFSGQRRRLTNAVSGMAENCLHYIEAARCDWHVTPNWERALVISMGAGLDPAAASRGCGIMQVQPLTPIVGEDGVFAYAGDPVLIYDHPGNPYFTLE